MALAPAEKQQRYRDVAAEVGRAELRTARVAGSFRRVRGINPVFTTTRILVGVKALAAFGKPNRIFTDRELVVGNAMPRSGPRDQPLKRPPGRQASAGPIRLSSW
jgi:hypothetical protein